MIGPHEGKELELMLAGEKKLAVFHDLAIPGQDIPEDIIPDKSFAPHVAKGSIKRFAEKIHSTKSGNTIHYVCFTLPGEEWRASFFSWLKQNTLGGLIYNDRAHDIVIGQLLGYSEEDIQDYLAQFD